MGTQLQALYPTTGQSAHSMFRGDRSIPMSAEIDGCRLYYDAVAHEVAIERDGVCLVAISNPATEQEALRLIANGCIVPCGGASIPAVPGVGRRRLRARGDRRAAGHSSVRRASRRRQRYQGARR